jgi:hypothetical protein
MGEKHLIGLNKVSNVKYVNVATKASKIASP